MGKTIDELKDELKALNIAINKPGVKKPARQELQAEIEAKKLEINAAEKESQDAKEKVEADEMFEALKEQGVDEAEAYETAYGKPMPPKPDPAAATDSAETETKPEETTPPVVDEKAEAEKAALLKAEEDAIAKKLLDEEEKERIAKTSKAPTPAPKPVPQAAPLKIDVGEAIKAPVKEKLHKVTPSNNFKSHIGGNLYVFKRNVVQYVPLDVKKILITTGQIKEFEM